MPKSKPKTKTRSPSPTRAKYKRRSYSDEFRAEALACLRSNAGNIKRTAKQLGIPEKTLEGWAKGRNHPVDAHLRDRKTGELKDALDEWIRDIMQIPMGAYKELSLQQAAIAVGIATDKIMLLTNRPTQIDEHRATGKLDLDRLTTDELLSLAALKAKAEGREPIVALPQPMPRITVDDGIEDDEPTNPENDNDPVRHDTADSDQGTGEEPARDESGTDAGTT